MTNQNAPEARSESSSRLGAGTDAGQIAPKQQWRRRDSPALVIRIMGVVEGYVIYRRKGCGPSMQHTNDFTKNFERIK